MLMRVIVGEKQPSAISESVKRWIESDTLRPDAIALVYALDAAIRDRIKQRQEAGDSTERFWGFNALYFLSRYQETWHDTLGVIAAHSSISPCKLDSSQSTPEEMVDIYARAVSLR